MLLLVLASCEDSNDYPEDSISLYQQYEVYIQDNSKAGFANFYVGNPEGERFRLTGDAKVMVNDNKMYYTPTVSSTYPEFNYSSYIDLTDDRAIFKLKRSKNRTLTNSISFTSIPNVHLSPEIKTVKNGDAIPYLVNGMLQPDDKVEVSLVNVISTNDAKIFKAVTSPFSNTFTISGVPAGTYNFRLDVVKTQNTQENDGNASGSIRVIRRKMAMEIKVTE